MLKMVDGTGIIGVDMVCPLGATVSPPQPPNYDKVEVEGVGSLMLPNSLKAPLERVELTGNSTQGENPAPEAPQEITSAGRKSKNLFNYKDFVDVNTYQDEGSGYRRKYLQLKPNTSYRMTIFKNRMSPPFDATVMFIGQKEDYDNVSANGAIALFTSTEKISKTIITKESGQIVFKLNKNSTPEIQEEYLSQANIILSEGGTEIPYEPFGYLLGLKVTGNNLLDMSAIVNENGYADSNFSNARDINHFYVTEGKRYLIIARGDTVDPKTGYSSIYFGENNLKYYEKASHVLDTPIGIRMISGNVRNTYIATANKTCTITKCMIHGTNNSNNAYTVEEIGVFELKNAETQEDVVYEPYTEQTVQIALDEPLRGIGEYKDVLTKDGIVRKIYPQYEVDLAEVNDGGYWKTNTVMFYARVQNKTVGYANLKSSILCNTLPDCALQTGNIYNIDKECIAVGGGNVLFRVNKNRLKDASSFEAAKQSFIECMADKKMIVEYALETPTTEPLPESVQQQLQALHTENGTTHVFVDSGEVEAGIKLTYRKEK